MTSAAKKLWADVVERTLWTFAQAFIGVLTANAFVDFDAAVWKQALVAGIAAGLAAVKGFVGSQVGQTGTASTLPATLDPAELPGRGFDPAP